MPTISESVEAKLQSQVATFLMLKEQLLKAITFVNPAISNKAKELYKNQLELEVELKKNLAITEQIKSGNYAYADLITLGLFANRLNEHTKASQKVIDQSKGLPTTDSYGNLAKWVFGGTAVVLSLIYLFKSSKK